MEPKHKEPSRIYMLFGFFAQVECKSITMDNCGMKDEKTANEEREEEEEEKGHRKEIKMDQAQGLQTQAQQTDTQADRWEYDPSLAFS